MTAQDEFDGLKYTRDSLAKQAFLVQLHASDGSAFQHCKCIQEKHLFGIEGLAEEGVSLSEDQKEKEFYEWLTGAMREVRKEIVDATFNVPNPVFGERGIEPKQISEPAAPKAHTFTLLFDAGAPNERFIKVEADTEAEAAIRGREEFSDQTGERHKTLQIIARNPYPREYLPHGLTAEEQKNARLRHKLASCIKQVEKKECHGVFHDGKLHYKHYDECNVNPVAVCRASVKT